jgi:hypothetical protein
VAQSGHALKSRTDFVALPRRHTHRVRPPPRDPPQAQIHIACDDGSALAIPATADDMVGKLGDDRDPIG